MSFYSVVREYYLRCGYDYNEASRHAAADVEYIRNILIGED